MATDRVRSWETGDQQKELAGHSLVVGLLKLLLVVLVGVRRLVASPVVVLLFTAMEMTAWI